MLLLVAIHFHSNQLNAISDLVSSTMGMKVPIRNNNMSRIKQIFTQEIFTEQVVTSHAVKVPVTVNLNANMSGFLPVHCIHQLLKSRAFTKHKVPIKDWIYRQICSSKPPLHPVLPALVEVFVNSILLPSAKSPLENTNQPISYEEISVVFEDILTEEAEKHGSSLSAQLLLLYYMLHYEDVRLNNLQVININGVITYPDKFISNLPIKYLLQQAQCNQQSFTGLFPPLLRLLATHFPHLSLVDDWIEEYRPSHEPSPACDPDLIDKGLKAISACPSLTGKVLKQLLEMPATQLWSHVKIIIQNYPSTLEPNVPRYLQELYRRVWLKLNTVLPQCLWKMTLKVFIHKRDPISRYFETSTENLVLDPLLVLHWDARVFRCAPLLKVFLRVLQGYLAASGKRYDQQKAANSSDTITDGELAEVKTTTRDGEYSCVLQMLMENCEENTDDWKIPGQLLALREVQSIICSFMHQVFISDPILAKLIHSQGYPNALLPIAVKGIPSMHICLDYIPEFLSKESIELQVFAVDLTSHLSLHYAMPKSMSIAKLTISTLSTLLKGLAEQNRVDLFIKCLPPLVRLCKAFPTLYEDIINLLLQLGRMSVTEACYFEKNQNAHLTNWKAVVINEDSNYLLKNAFLVGEIKRTFLKILRQAILKVRVY